ncbi:MAG: hypothetical protein ABFS45_13480, partial [Pseudomonadota bacterium]
MSATKKNKPQPKWMSILFGGTCLTLVLSTSSLFADIPNVSINSTSQNNPHGPPAEPVAEQPFIDLDEFTVISVNDLGIHCGDMDTRVVNILPPFNVMHALVIQRGKKGAVALDDSQVSLFYSAVSNPNDPALALTPMLAPDGSVFKTNFWDAVAAGAY